MFKNALLTINAKILLKGVDSIKIRTENAEGWLINSHVQFQDEYNNIFVGDNITLKVPKWHFDSIKHPL